MGEKPKTAVVRPLRGIAAAIGLLTRLPVPGGGGAVRPGDAWAWPVAGLAVGCVGGLAGAAALGLGLPAPLAAGLCLGALILATGGLHEDGLADTADGLWGGGTPDRRLEIMRDSRIGSYGTLALVVVTGLRWQALATLAAAGGAALVAGVIVAGAAGRAPMAAVMAALPPARSDGLSRLVGQPPTAAAWGGAAIAAGAALILWPGAVPALLLLCPLPALWLGGLARRRLGGQTGDVLGATQQLSETVALAVLAASV